MTKTKKIVLISTALLLAGAGTVFATRKKKPVAKVIKKVAAIIWPAGADSSEPVTEEGETSIKLGSSGRYVEQLQAALNDIHKAATYIKNNCEAFYASYKVTPINSAGDILVVNGNFDKNTENASQFYLNRKEVDLSFLSLIRQKISKRYSDGDLCILPTGVVL
jgi:peptidoglycan hydrolase-like protein with peptidoglycan-binding domain